MESILEKVICSCAVRALGPLDSPCDVGSLAHSVRQTIEAESPIYLPDDARRVAEALSTSLKVNGLARPSDALADPLEGYLNASDYRLAMGLEETIGIGVSRMEVEMLIVLLQNKVLEIDARPAGSCEFETKSRACERELVIRLKNVIAEGKRRYLKS